MTPDKDRLQMFSRPKSSELSSKHKALCFFLIRLYTIKRVTESLTAIMDHFLTLKCSWLWSCSLISFTQCPLKGFKHRTIIKVWGNKWVILYTYRYAEIFYKNEIILCEDHVNLNKRVQVGAEWLQVVCIVTLTVTV